MRVIPKGFKRGAMLALVALGAVGASASAASAQYLTQACDQNGQQCVMLRCEANGDNCQLDRQDDRSSYGQRDDGAQGYDSPQGYDRPDQGAYDDDADAYAGVAPGYPASAYPGAAYPAPAYSSPAYPEMEDQDDGGYPGPVALPGYRGYQDPDDE